LSAGDSLAVHTGQKFSTMDQDNDAHPSVSCAEVYKGGWWFSNCHQSNLNGLYMGTATTYGAGIVWSHWKGYIYSMNFSEMKTRPGTDCYLYTVRLRYVKVYGAVELNLGRVLNRLIFVIAMFFKHWPK